jgi:hypothetical protein
MEIGIGVGQWEEKNNFEFSFILVIQTFIHDKERMRGRYFFSIYSFNLSFCNSYNFHLPHLVEIKVEVLACLKVKIKKKLFKII